MGWVRWVLAYLTHDMGILVMQFEEVYQGKVNKYVNSNVASGTPWRHTTGFDTQQLHPQKSYECCHVCHVPKGNFQVCKNKQLKQPKKGENRGRPTTANQQRKIHIDIGLIYWYQLVKIPPPPMESSINICKFPWLEFKIHRCNDTNDSMESWRTYPWLVQPRGCDAFMLKRDGKHHYHIVITLSILVPSSPPPTCQCHLSFQGISH